MFQTQQNVITDTHCAPFYGLNFFGGCHRQIMVHQRRVGHADVARVKRIQDAFGAKLKDVLLACATGALRTTTLGQGGWGDKDETKSSRSLAYEAISTETHSSSG